MIYNSQQTSQKEKDILSLIIESFTKNINNPKEKLDLEKINELILDGQSPTQPFVASIFLTCIYEHLYQSSDKYVIKLEYEEAVKFADSLSHFFENSSDNDNESFFKNLQIMENGKEHSFQDPSYYNSLTDDEKLYFILGYGLNSINKEIQIEHPQFEQIDFLFTQIFDKIIKNDIKNLDINHNKKQRTVKF